MHSTGRDLTRLARGVVVSVVAFVLTGCGGAVLKKDYEDFAASYADSSNGQMLMNLARRDQGHRRRAGGRLSRQRRVRDG